jgi:peptidoglycan-N-acetylmuramic acid deacetylase
MRKNAFIFSLLLAVLLTAVCLFKPAGVALADNVVSWGLTPNNDERIPAASAYGQKLLKENNGIYFKETDEKRIYFTFDLGYEAGYTDKVLDILKANGLKAVFFLCGNYLQEKELIERMLSEGHSIGNHTDRHKDLPTLSEEGIRKDIADFNEKYKAKFSEAAPLKFFRPPQGRFSEKVLKEADGQGLKTLMWSIAIVDWGKTPINAKENADKIAGRLHKGAIILFHITNPGTVDMLKLLIPKTAEKGYIIGSPDELSAGFNLDKLLIRE